MWQVCRETYGVSTDVIVTGDVLATMPYIPTHLDYMLYELLKNAMRAVVEAHPRRSALPPVHMRVCQGDGTVTLRVSDQVRRTCPVHLTVLETALLGVRRFCSSRQVPCS
jgi:hypothetical protein